MIFSNWQFVIIDNEDFFFWNSEYDDIFWHHQLIKSFMNISRNVIDWYEKLIRQFSFKNNKKADQLYSDEIKKSLNRDDKKKNLTIIESKWLEWNKNRAKCLVILQSLKWYLSKTRIWFSNIIYISLSIKIYFFNIIRLSIVQWTSTTDITCKWTTYRIEESKYRNHQNTAKQTYHFDYNRHHQIESTYLELNTYINSCLYCWRYPQIDFLYHLRINIWWQNECRWKTKVV